MYLDKCVSFDDWIQANSCMWVLISVSGSNSVCWGATGSWYSNHQCIQTDRQTCMHNIDSYCKYTAACARLCLSAMTKLLISSPSCVSLCSLSLLHSLTPRIPLLVIFSLSNSSNICLVFSFFLWLSPQHWKTKINRQNLHCAELLYTSRESKQTCTTTHGQARTLREEN